MGRVTKLGIATCVVACVFIASCSSDGSDNSTAATTPPSSEAPSTSTTTPPTDLRSTTVDFKSNQGYTEHVEFQHGQLGHALPNHQYACDANPETDAVVPFRLTVTNTTSGFSTKSGMYFKTDQPTYGSSFNVEAGFDFATPECKPASSQTDWYGMEALSELAPRDSVSATGEFVIHKYYTPAMPQGDASGLRSVLITFYPIAGPPGGYQPTTATNAINPRGNPGYWSFPLDPSSDGGCLAAGYC